jgi:diguanylate cyclase (GGDEF)-like protein
MGWVGMKRISRFNRIFTVLIFVVVASLTAYGYGSLVIDASVGNAVQSQFALYDAYRNLDEASVGNEIHNNVAWAALPSRASWQRAVEKQRAFDEALASLRRTMRTPADTAAIETIARAHRAAVAASWHVMRLATTRQSAAAKRAYDGEVLPAYQYLSDRIEAMTLQHYALANVLDARWRALERSLQWAMIGIGLAGLLVLTGLAATVRAYRIRADQATERELHRLERAALSDSLTGLGNHRAFREDLLKEISRSRRHDHALTLVLLDVDDFKTLNDARGHAHGDAVLVQTARTLQSSRLEDRAYRVGGDEFAMLLIETDRAHTKGLLDRLRERLKERLDGATVSMGFCQMESGFDERDLYERADAALYAAKRSGRDTTVDFAAIRRNTTIVPARKSVALQTLLEERALEVDFQPIWNVSTKSILGFEALARPAACLGFTGPQEAFDVAERQRRVADLDRLCIDRIFAAAAGLPESHLLFVNVTPESLGRADFRAKSITGAALAFGLRPQRLVIELTERRITDTRELLRTVAELRKLGVLIALDDTGTGSAGLEILTKFTFDFVKIDRSVIAEAMLHKRACGVLAGIVAIAHEGGSFVIAEGIEHVDQLAFLQKLRGAPAEFGGVNGVQGYLLGRPRRELPNAAAFARCRRILSEPPAGRDSVAS